MGFFLVRKSVHFQIDATNLAIFGIKGFNTVNSRKSFTQKETRLISILSKTMNFRLRLCLRCIDLNLTIPRPFLDLALTLP